MREDSGSFAFTSTNMTMGIVALTRGLFSPDSNVLPSILPQRLNEQLMVVETGWARRRWLESIGLSKMTQIDFMCVPGQAGIRANEHAIRPAGMGAVGMARAMDWAAILDAIR